MAAPLREATHVVRMGRKHHPVTHLPVVKTLFFYNKVDALKAANALAYLLMGTHHFKRSDANNGLRVIGEDFWVEIKPA